MVESIVHRVVRELMLPASETPDLMAYAFQGLVEAKKRFDPSRGVLFRTFASYRVRGAVIDGVREMSRLSRRAHARLKAAEAADRITEDVAYAPRERGGASLDQTVKSIDTALARLTTNFVLAHASEHKGSEAVDEGPSPEESFLHAESKRRLHDALEILDERERALIVGYYFEGIPFDQTAKKLGISKSWASRIYTRALDRLRAALVEGETPALAGR